MGERARTRALVTAAALRSRLTPRAAPGPLRRVLVAHNLLLGDTLMLTPLLAKLRANHADADIVLLAAPAAVTLYGGRPYGVRALPFKPADSSTARALLAEKPFDLAIVVGDNRYSWLAAAMRARHVVAHSGDRPWTKDLFVDEQRDYARQPSAWGDMVAALADGADPAPYRRGDWPPPAAAPFELPRSPYVVLHLGASTPLKLWPAQRWMALAEHFAERGFGIVWSAGPGEEPLVAQSDPAGRFRSCAGTLDLPQMWRLLSEAALLVVPDTGIAHLGRATWTPTVAIFGPGSATLCAPGQFWRDTPWRAVTVEDFPCRDQRLLFRREVDWVRRCARTTRECAEPRCMQAVSVADVIRSVESLQVMAP